MTYNYCKKIIASGNYDKADMTDMLDVFLLRKRIIKKQYNELHEMMKEGDK